MPERPQNGPGTDPVGRLIDAVAELILEFNPTGRRRLTGDPITAREMATEIVDLVWEWEYDEEDPDA